MPFDFAGHLDPDVGPADLVTDEPAAETLLVDRDATVHPDLVTRDHGFRRRAGEVYGVDNDRGGRSRQVFPVYTDADRIAADD